MDADGFTGAEKALIACLGLAIVLAGGRLISGGSGQAAEDARRTLATREGSTNWTAGVSHFMQAGEPNGAGPINGGPVGGRQIEPMRASAPSDANLTYRGGKVISNVKVIAVFWENGNNTVPSNVKDGMPGFYQAVTKSPYMDWLSEYNTPTQQIGRGSYGGAVTIHPGHDSNNITNEDIQAEINQQIDAGNLPAPDANTIYMISFPPQVSVAMGTDKSCESFCAYHNTMQRNGQSVYYGVLPDVGPDSNCSQGCGNSANSFDNQTSVASHELIESVTDPDVGLADNDASKLGWYDDKYGEIGDICNAQQGNLPGTSYTVQKEYSDGAHDCIVAKDASPAVSANLPK